MQKFIIIRISLLLFVSMTLIFLIQVSLYYLTASAYIPSAGSLPILNDTSVTLSDPNLKIEVFATGLESPTNMAFLDSGDALILEKQNGTVRMINNASLLPRPLLDANVANYDTRGMLGIAVANNATVGKQYVFLYYTEAKDNLADGKDKCYSPSRCVPGYFPNGNRLYRYELSEDGTELINKKQILSWPGFKSADHNGGELIVGPDNNLYLMVGEAGNRSRVSNVNSSASIIGTAGILALDHNGGAISNDGILGREEPLNKYYAYGIRNGFGLDFDPLTGILWDTENGPRYGDEINLVQPGFNSGWKIVQGLSKLKLDFDKNKLQDFGGKGKYSDPEFVWNETVAPTAIKFLDSDKYGKQYKDDIFVGSVGADGNLYHFDLDSTRKELLLHGPLKDKIANNSEELSEIVFGRNFGVISDIEVGPDGYLYIVSYSRGEIYRIIPS